MSSTTCISAWIISTVSNLQAYNFINQGSEKSLREPSQPGTVQQNAVPYPPYFMVLSTSQGTMVGGEDMCHQSQPVAFNLVTLLWVTQIRIRCTYCHHLGITFVSFTIIISLLLVAALVLMNKNCACHCLAQTPHTASLNFHLILFILFFIDLQDILR